MTLKAISPTRAQNNVCHQISKVLAAPAFPGHVLKVVGQPGSGLSTCCLQLMTSLSPPALMVRPLLWEKGSRFFDDFFHLLGLTTNGRHPGIIGEDIHEILKLRDITTVVVSDAHEYWNSSGAGRYDLFRVIEQLQSMNFVLFETLTNPAPVPDMFKATRTVEIINCRSFENAAEYYQHFQLEIGNLFREFPASIDTRLILGVLYRASGGSIGGTYQILATAHTYQWSPESLITNLTILRG